jgi:predicted DCC family thiol-disulfide oxidoreductase YuxK
VPSRRTRYNGHQLRLPRGTRILRTAAGQTEAGLTVDFSGHAVIVFDGECAFCNRWVNLLLRFDRKDIFRFAARQSQSGAAYSRDAGLPEAGVGSIILVEDNRVRLRSDAVLRMLGLLGFPFRLAAVFRLIPASVRDAVYDVIARNRTRWFGRLPSCRIPTSSERHRFI